ncbi:MAG: transketolase, partial [Phycisphaerae bacterium]|nr:transketolase [Phycisphaerae bacterium]
MTNVKTHVNPAVDLKLAQTIANTIRFLSADGVQKAKSGHPGMPMGCADIAAVLLTRVLRIDPNDSKWFNRDRFVLSAGHGSMLLYSMMHLMGYLPMDELKQFRQYKSKTPGHPEVTEVPGCDVTGGPLGAGFSTAVGLALAERMLAARYNRPGREAVDHFTYVIMGDGCQMEGLTQEAASLAGHLKLAKLIAFYDDNEISIEGSTDLAFTENVNARYEALGWQVQDIDGHDHDAIAAAVLEAQKNTEKPSIIVCHTTIGKGAPNKAGKSSSHGEPLGEEEVLAGKKLIGWPEEPFYVPEDVYNYFEKRKSELIAERQAWNDVLAGLTSFDAKAGAELKRIIAGELPDGWEDATPTYPADEKGLATRASGGEVLNAFAEKIDELIGGAADLAPSTKTYMKKGNWTGDLRAGDYAQRNLHFGVREHAMGNIVNGLALHGLLPFGSTFLVFHDYMRPALRLAAIQELRSIFVYTHDSFYVGEDGPTH